MANHRCLEKDSPHCVQHYFTYLRNQRSTDCIMYYLGMISNLLLHATPNVIFSPAKFFNCEMLWSVFIPKYILVIIETALLLKKQFLCIIHSNFFVYCTYVLRGNKETSTFRKITAVFRDTSHYYLFNFMLYQSVILTILSWKRDFQHFWIHVTPFQSLNGASAHQLQKDIFTHGEPHLWMNPQHVHL